MLRLVEGAIEHGLGVRTAVSDVRGVLRYLQTGSLGIESPRHSASGHGGSVVDGAPRVTVLDGTFFRQFEEMGEGISISWDPRMMLDRLHHGIRSAFLEAKARGDSERARSVLRVSKRFHVSLHDTLLK